jgi:DNA-binding LytR/AlgR family response regulator
MKVVIIEDEPFARLELKRILKNINTNITVVKEIDSVQDAVEWLSDNQNFDLIFLDIQLADGLSFEMFAASSEHGSVGSVTSVGSVLTTDRSINISIIE